MKRESLSVPGLGEPSGFDVTHPHRLCSAVTHVGQRGAEGEGRWSPGKERVQVAVWTHPHWTFLE